jgi:hypothetical protein
MQIGGGDVGPCVEIIDQAMAVAADAVQGYKIADAAVGHKAIEV